MCGIGGIISKKNKPILYNELKIISEANKNRGPDSYGEWINNNKTISIINRRLSTQDARSIANQPIFSSNGRSVTVLNGEIYNHFDLRNFLKKKGYSFKSNSDAETLAATYDYWGEKLIEKLEGQYAFFALNIDENKGILVRDRFGISPIYYVNNNDYFYFSSLQKPLIQILKKNHSLNLKNTSVSEFIVSDMCYQNNTIFESIKYMSPSNFILFENNQSSLPKFFNYMQQDFFEIKKEKKDYFIDKSKKLIQESINKTLSGDKNVGIYLSGGIDSISIVSLIKKYYPEKNINTYTAAFKDSSNEIIGELETAKQVSDHFNLNNYQYITSSNAIFDSLGSFDQPEASIINSVLNNLSKIASLNKDEVVLSGEGADEIFLGYDHFLALIKNFDQKYENILKDYNLRNSQYFDNSKNFTDFFLGGGVDIDLNLNLNKVFNDSSLHSTCISKEVNNTINELATLGLNPLLHQKLIYIDYKFKVSENLLRRAEEPSMNNGVEMRFPYLYSKLIDFIIKCPLEILIGDGTTKSLFREILKDDVHIDFLLRQKSPFGLPAARKKHFKNSKLSFKNPAFKDIFFKNLPLVKEILYDTKLGKLSLFKQDFIESKINDQLDYDKSYFDTILWKLISLFLWYEKNS